jgi:hypothetical protein
LRRLLSITTLALLLVFGLALTAQAHNFNGSGDCDGWTLQLDGDFGATEIYVDGNPVGLGLTYNFPDTSDAETREFTVVWQKPGPDVTVTHVLERVLDCTPVLPPTVTATCELITIDAAEGVEWAVQIADGYVDGEGTDSFTGLPGQPWAVFYNDQTIASGVFEACTTTTSTVGEQPSTTTTLPTTTTSENPTTTSSEPETTTTNPAPTTTAPTGTTTPTELPFTGIEDWYGYIAAAFILLGGLMVWTARERDDEDSELITYD